MKEIFRTVLNMSLTGSAVILLVMAARLALKRTPKIFSYALWGVVLFRLLCPVSLSSSVSLLGWLKPEVTAPTAVTSTVSYIPSAPTRQETAETVPPSPGEAPTAVRERDAEAPDLLMVGACIWAIGAAAMAGYSLAQYLRFRGKLAGAVSVVEIKAHFLHVGEQVPADVRLHPDAENVAEKADSVVKKRPDHIEENHCGHQREEDPVLPLRKQIVQRLPGDQGEGQVNEGDADGAGHIYGE